MFVLSITFIAGYVLLTAAVMYVNTTVLRLGDPKFGGGGFELYWPLWMAFYSPVVIAALAAVWWSGLTGLRSLGLAGLMLAVILVVFEVSLLFDIHWSVLLIEWVVLAIVFFSLARAWSG
ncbi:MAG: hypothetical protein WD069_05265 [Planctomycetales bacterium]